jgi:hypothetical protein
VGNRIHVLLSHLLHLSEPAISPVTTTPGGSDA